MIERADKVLAHRVAVPAAIRSPVTNSGSRQCFCCLPDLDERQYRDTCFVCSRSGVVPGAACFPGLPVRRIHREDNGKDNSCRPEKYIFFSCRASLSNSQGCFHLRLSWDGMAHVLHEQTVVRMKGRWRKCRCCLLGVDKHAPH